MRKRYVQLDGELVEVTPDWKPDPVSDVHVISDIEPYQSMKTGEMIQGRRQHREHLRQHGLIEIGNEVKHLKPYGARPLPGLKERIVEIAREKLRYN